MEEYDFILHLNPTFLARADERIPGTVRPKHAAGIDESALKIDGGRVLTRVLRETFEPRALFFYDVCGGSAIGGLWAPTEPRRIEPGFNCLVLPSEAKPSAEEKGEEEGDGRVVLNRDAMVCEIERLAGPMVSRIERRR